MTKGLQIFYSITLKGLFKNVSKCQTFKFNNWVGYIQNENILNKMKRNLQVWFGWCGFIFLKQILFPLKFKICLSEQLIDFNLLKYIQKGTRYNISVFFFFMIVWFSLIHSKSNFCPRFMAFAFLVDYNGFGSWQW